MAINSETFDYLSNPDIQYTDQNGKPVSNGYVKYCITGTSTPYITYQNWDGATNPSEIRLNSAGRCVAIASITNRYDEYVYDRTHKLVYSRVNIGIGGNGEVVIEGVVTDLTNSDGDIDLSMTETSDHRRVYDVNLSDEFKDLVDSKASQEALNTEIENRELSDQNLQNAITNEAEARKNKDDDLQEQIDNIDTSSYIEGEFIEFQDEGSKKSINVSPTKDLVFDTETLDVEDTDEYILVKGKTSKPFKFQYKNLSENTPMLYIAQTSDINYYTGIIYGANESGNFLDGGVRIGKQVSPQYPLEATNITEDKYDLILSQYWLDNTIAKKTDIQSITQADSGLSTSQKVTGINIVGTNSSHYTTFNLSGESEDKQITLVNQQTFLDSTFEFITPSTITGGDGLSLNAGYTYLINAQVTITPSIAIGSNCYTYIHAGGLTSPRFYVSNVPDGQITSGSINWTITPETDVTLYVGVNGILSSDVSIIINGIRRKA